MDWGGESCFRLTNHALSCEAKVNNFHQPEQRCKMDKNKLSDLAGRLQKGGKGAGVGAGLIAAAGAAMYGIYQSFYTGNELQGGKLG